MKNSKPSEWDEFIRRVYVRAPIDEVYKRWSTCKGITSWFLGRAELYNSEGRKSDTDPAQKGDAYEWQWVSNPFIGRGKILKANGKDHFGFSFIEDNTRTSIRLKEKNGRTLVELRQRHLHPKPNQRKKIFLDCHSPWSYHLTNLKSILEGGIDLREQHPDMKGLVNS